MMSIVSGHLVGGVMRPFPHCCPGIGCAVRVWLERTTAVREYNALKPLPWTGARFETDESAVGDQSGS